MPDAGTIITCMRLKGHSASTCACRIEGGGWLPCPDTARQVLTPTYPPASYQAPVPTHNKSHAVAAGYTGSICDACGSTRMRRAGTCETCDDCGTAGGCG